MTFTDTIAQYISLHQLMNKDAKYLVALSGGADSVCLLLILQQMGYNIEAVHCNFHLRGDESDCDEHFVRQLCKNKNIPLHIAHFQTKYYAEVHKISIEMGARALRYDYFERLRRDIDATDICVAHHRDDSVETFLMNVIRGTGVHGLTGIAARNGHIIRPLLCVSRKDIETYLGMIGQEFVTDSTNLVDDVTRNKIRLDIIPLMEQINPMVSANIHKTAERMLEVACITDQAIQTIISNSSTTGKNGEIRFDLVNYANSGSMESVLFSFLKTYGFSPAQIEQIYHHIDASAGTYFSSYTHELVFDRNSIIVRKIEEVVRPLKLPETGIYKYGTRKVSVNIVDEVIVSKDAMKATLDADKVDFPITIRTCMAGEKFVPFGMRGAKLISDYLTDLKMNLFEKRNQLVVADASGRIIWVVGLRTDNRYRISVSTKKTLIIEFR